VKPIRVLFPSVLLLKREAQLPMNGMCPPAKRVLGRVMQSMTNRLVLAAGIALAAVALSAPALAAEIVDLRIGNHATYTRVVFELDAASGYSVERRLAEDGVAQLLVTVDATSAPRSVDSRSVMVERVAVQEGVESSVAHIRLKHKPSRLKEMILSNPPRLVFDFVFPESMIAAGKAAAAKRAVAAAEVATTAGRQAAPSSKPTAGPSGQTARAPKASIPKPQKVNQASTPPQPTARPSAKPQPAQAQTRVAKTTTKPTASPAPKPASAVSKPAAAVVNAAKPEVVTPAAVSPRKAQPQPANNAAARPAGANAVAGPREPAEEEAVVAAKRKVAARDKVTPKAVQPRTAANKKKATRSTVPAAPASAPESGGPDWVLVGGIAAGVGALFIAFFVWNRRRALPNDVDVSALAEDAAGDAASEPQGFVLRIEETTITGPYLHEPETTTQAEPETAAGLFDDDSDKESNAMDLETPDLPQEHTASEMPTQVGVTADASGGDVARMLREFESRLVKLETQLDEATDARERLERQVTAQAEELRVQRAAIARTQRALRGMDRGASEQATEPAIREPSS
jgi:hypothetical protein